MSAVTVPNGITSAGLAGVALVHAEIWVSRKLANRTLFAGVTDHNSRIGLLRAHLVAHGLEDAPVTSDETWRQVFERIYGEPL